MPKLRLHSQRTDLPGCFIVVEGVDGAGKTGHAAELVAWLRLEGYLARLVRDPGDTELGCQLRQLLLHATARPSAMAELFLFAAARSQLVHECILPGLSCGEVVVSDRYHLSTAVYQHGAASSHDLQQVVTMSTCGALPSLTLLLDIPAEAACLRLEARGELDAMESGRLRDLDVLRQRYLAASRRDETVVVVDASEDFASVQLAMRQHVRSQLLAKPRILRLIG